MLSQPIFLIKLVCWLLQFALISLVWALPRHNKFDILFYDNLVLNTENLTIPHKYFHKRAFSCTICSDYAIAVTVGKFHVDLLKENPFTKLHSQISRSNHFRLNVFLKFSAKLLIISANMKLIGSNLHFNFSIIRRKITIKTSVANTSSKKN